MSIGYINKFCYFNGQLTENALIENIESEISVYEVFKVVSGVALFFEDHIERLNRSLQFVDILDFNILQESLEQQVTALCNANDKYFGNIELRFSKIKEGNYSLSMGFIAHKYPNPIAYIEGVEVSLMAAERLNPNAKVKQSETRIKANEYLKGKSVFEVLLVNQSKYITEGSRSNVFFIRNKEVYTAPFASILPGITRKFALKALENKGVLIKQKHVKSSDLCTYNAAFLCGTSIGILPISKIGEHQFEVKNEILQIAMQEFNKIVGDYFAKKLK